MYTIYSEIYGQRVCLHDDTVTNAMVHVIEPMLTLEDNAAGSLEFKLAPTNIGYAVREYTETVVETIELDGVYKGDVYNVSDLLNIQDPQDGDIWGVLADNSKRKYSSEDGWMIYTEQTTTREVTRTVDLVERMKSIIKVYEDGEEIWEGRVLSEKQDFFNCRSIYCEGEMAYLNDTCQPAMEYHDITLREYLDSVLNYHNRKVDVGKRFTVGIVTVKDGPNPTQTAEHETGLRYTQYEKTMETINKLVEELGGHLRIRKENGVRYLDYLEDYPNTSTQTINFGKNLLEFTREYDMSSLCTAVLVTGSVIEKEGGTKVGKELTLYHYPAPSGDHTIGQSTGYILSQANNQSEVSWTYNADCAGYHTARAEVEPGKTYYVSCRLHGGYVMYCLRGNADGTGDYFAEGIKKASSNIGFTDCVETKIKIPKDCHSIILCGFGDSIPLRVNESLDDEDDTELEAYTTLEDYPETTYHPLGSLYVVNPEAVTQYGWIEQRLDLSDVSDKEVLYASAVAYLTNGQFDEMTIELTAVDMNLLGVQSDKIHLLDKVWVISEPHGLERLFPVTKLEIPLDHPADMKFSLGSKTEQSLTSVNNDIKDDLLSKIAGIPSYSKTLASAKNNAAQLIADATNGYVTIVHNGNGAQELVVSDYPITDEQDWPHVTNCWVWNVNGLCHANHYPLTSADTPNVAITMDGQIVADYITAGSLTAINIRGCNFVAGGMDGQQGYVLVKQDTGLGPCVELKNGQLVGSYIESGGSGTPTPHSYIDCGSVMSDPSTGTDRRGMRIRSKDYMTIETSDLGIGTFDSSGNLKTSTGASTFGWTSNPAKQCKLCFMDQNGNIDGYPCAIVNGMIVGNFWNNVPTW